MKKKNEEKVTVTRKVYSVTVEQQQHMEMVPYEGPSGPYSFFGLCFCVICACCTRVAHLKGFLCVPTHKSIETRTRTGTSRTCPERKL